MSVPDIEPVKTSSGDGVNKIFDYGFRINSESEILVQHTNVDGAQKTLVLNTDYSVSGVGSKNGGNVIFPLGTSTYSILSSGEKLTRSLDLPFKQEGGYDKSGGLSLVAVENSLDYQTRMAQILRRKIDRCVKVKEGSGADPDSLIESIDASVITAGEHAASASGFATAASESAIDSQEQATLAAQSVSNFMSTYQGALQDVQDSIGEIEVQTIESLNELKAAGYGLPPSNCTAMDIVKGTSSYFLKWKDPQDTIVNSQTLCTWAGTKIVRQVGHCPLSPTDGVLIYDSKIRNAYENTTLIDADITVGVDYYYTAFPYSVNGAVNYDRKNQFGTIIYGYELNLVDSNPRTFFKRLADCENFHNVYMDYTSNVFVSNEWADAWFVKKNRPVMLNYDGTVAYELNHFDHTKKLNGVDASDIANTAFGGNAMSEIPQVWTKVEFDGLKIRKYFANRQVDATYRADAFYNKNNVLLDKIYMPMYNGSYISSKTRSLSGQATGNSLAGATEIAQAVENGAAWYTEVNSDRILINDLLLLMGGSFDTQSVYGNGHYTGGTAASSLLATGTMNQKGQFYGTNGSGVGMKVFYIENWWGNIWRRIAGWVNVNGVQKIKLTQGTQDGSTATNYNTDGTGYISIGATPSGTSGGYQSGFALNQYGFFPQVANGSSSTFSCDGFWFNNAQNNYALVGGNCGSGLLVGAFSSSLGNLVSNAYWNIGSSVSCKPL